jgi:hypothetical protein
MGSNICDSDKHFELNIVTGALVSNMQKVSLIRGSHNSERFSFDFPRYIECQDLTQCNKVEVHFINVGNETNKGARPIEDVRVVEGENDKITFSWLIDGECTKYAGSLSFVIHFKIEEDGKLKYKYPTGIFKGITINDGIDNGEAIIEDYNDIITEWMAEIEANIDNVVQDAVQSVVEENIGEAVEEAVNAIVEPKVDAAIEAALQDSAIYPENYANAITGYASGTSLQIDDLSPLASKVKVNVVGKQPPEVPMMMSMRSASPASEGLVNLVPFPYQDAEVGKSKTVSGITFRANADGSINVAGVAGATVTIILCRDNDYITENEGSEYNFEPDQYYTLWQGSVGGVQFKTRTFKEGETSSGKTFLDSTDNNSKKMWSDAVGIDFYLYIPMGTDVSAGVTIYPMIVEGQNVEITEYVPPIGAEGGESGGGGETPSDPTTVTITTASADDPETIVETIKTTSGAIVELTPIFPSMIITTDSDEVLLSAEYNKDTNAVIEELREAIGEGGGVTDADKEEIKEEIKADVVTMIGDIDSVLDSIIELQKTVIGEV